MTKRPGDHWERVPILEPNNEFPCTLYDSSLKPVVFLQGMPSWPKLVPTTVAIALVMVSCSEVTELLNPESSLRSPLFSDIELSTFSL